MMRRLSIFFKPYKQTFAHLQKHNFTLLAAALSYQTIFVLSPLLYFVVNLFSLIYDNQEVRQAILEYISRIYGSAGTDFASILIENTRAWGNVWWLNLIFLSLFLYGVAGFASQISYSFNKIWETENLKVGWKHFARQHIHNLSTVFGLILLMFFLNLLNSILSYFFDLLPDNWIPAETLNQISFLLVFSLLLFLLAKVMVKEKLQNFSLFIGTAHASLLFSIGKGILSWYLARNSLSLYGASSSLVVFLIWINFSAQTIFFGLALAKTLQNASPKWLKNLEIGLYGIFTKKIKT